MRMVRTSPTPDSRKSSSRLNGRTRRSSGNVAHRQLVRSFSTKPVDMEIGDLISRILQACKKKDVTTMRKLILAALAASTFIATPALAANFSGTRVGATIGTGGDDPLDFDGATVGVEIGHDFDL